MRAAILLSLTFVIGMTTLSFAEPRTQEFQALMKRAKAARKAGAVDCATTLFEHAAKLEPGGQEVHFFLGDTYSRPVYVGNHEKPWTADLSAAAKATREYQRVIEIAPEYNGEILITDPYSKLTSLWGSIAEASLSRGDRDSAAWAFHQGQASGGYYPALLEYNRNVLASCDSNAILFSNGDNDTYPIWYLQTVEKYRIDVSLINLPMANASWYLKQVKGSSLFCAVPVEMGMADAGIDSLKRLRWTTHNVEIPAAGAGPGDEIVWSVKPTVGDSGIRIQDQAVLKMLEANFVRRPIYFAVTVADHNMVGLKDYLTFEGLVYRLQSNIGERINEARITRNLGQVYKYEALQDHRSGYCREMRSAVQNYRSAFLQMAHAQQVLGEKRNALAFIDAMDERIPTSIFPYENKRMEAQVEAMRKALSE